MFREMLILFCCLIPAAVCAVKDFRNYTIPNKITLPMLAAGIVYAIFAKNIQDALLGLALAGGTLFICALIGGAGGGDFKLAAALGMWFGFWGSFWIVQIACVLGAAWGFWKLAKEGRLKARLQLFLQGMFYETVYGMRGTAILPKLPEDLNAPVPSDAVPFGVCLALAAWTVWGMRLLTL